MRIGQNSAINFVSQVAASVLGFVANLYLARTLGPDTLGVYFVVVAVLIWLKILGGMGVVTALRKRLSETGDEAEYLTVGVLSQVAVFAVMATVLLAARGYIREYLRGISVPLVVGLLGLALWFQFMLAVLDGQHKVHLSSLLAPLERLVRSGVQIAAVFLGYTLSGLLFGYGVAALVAAVAGVAFARSKLAVPERRHMADLVSYARYSWLGTLSGRAFASMDTLVLGLFVADGLIGVYEIAWNLASILAVFGTSINRALFPEMSKLSSEGGAEPVGELVTSGLRYAGLFLVPGLVGAALVGDRLLAIYGEAFPRGHVVLVVLVAARLVHTYGANLINSLNAIDRPERAFRVNAVFATSNVVLNLVLVYAFGWYGAAVATSFSAGVALVLGYRSIRKFVPVDVPLREIGRQVLSAGVMGVVVFAGRGILPNRLLVTVALVLGGAAVYVSVLLGVSPEFRSVVRTNLPT